MEYINEKRVWQVRNMKKLGGMSVGKKTQVCAVVVVGFNKTSHFYKEKE